MPTYVYRCKACEHQFETIQRITEEPVKECPECRGAVTRMLFPVGIVFKGSGFHVNDYPSSGSRSGASTGSGQDPSTSSGQDGNGKKADRKSESKSESKEPTTAPKD